MGSEGDAFRPQCQPTESGEKDIGAIHCCKSFHVEASNPQIFDVVKASDMKKGVLVHV
jgi:hypothetical protein